MATVEEARASEWLGRSVAIRRACCAADPTHAVVTCELAVTLFQLGQAGFEQGSQEEATSHLLQAHKLFEQLREAGALEARHVKLADMLAQRFSKRSEH